MMHRISVLALVVATATPALAVDEVIRQSASESVRGTISKLSKNEVTVESIGRSTAVPATDIAAVRWDGEPPQLNITRTRENNGDLDFALESYREIQGQIASDKPNLKTDVEFLIARTLAKKAISDSTTKDAAVKALNAFVNSHADNFRYYDAIGWLGRVHLAAGDIEAAKADYGKLAQSPLPEVTMSAQNALARIKLEQDDLAGASADFDAVLAQNAASPAAAQQKFAAELGKALVLGKQGNHEEAVKTFDSVITKASPDNAPVQAEAFLYKGSSLEALGREQDALLAFLHVDILFPDQPEEHAEALYHLTKLWAVAGKAERSAEARRRLTEQYPASEWTKKL